LGLNIGDLVYQLIMFILLFGMIFAVYFFVRSLLARSNKSNRMEQKLDRVIELLEKDKRE
jgi:membrane protein implicated in regulation of membrane protease activity